MARLIWSRRAKDHLRRIRRNIANDSPHAAKQVATRLTRATRRLEQFPFSGRVVPEDPAGELREIIVPPYRIMYEVKDDVVEIVALRHGAQNLTDLRDE